MGDEVFLNIPDLIAEDFQQFGADAAIPCSICSQEPANQVGLINDVHSPLCEYCWAEVQTNTNKGKLTAHQSVEWKYVIPALIFLTGVGGYLWGLLQKPGFAPRGFLLLIFPLGAR